MKAINLLEHVNEEKIVTYYNILKGTIYMHGPDSFIYIMLLSSN